MRPVYFPDDEQFWFETLRSFGHVAYGGADFGEVAMTAEQIKSRDYDSWHDEWLATADRVAAEAEAALTRGHHVSARDGLLRAANYYRNAEFFLHGEPDDPRIRRAYDRQVECFRQAAALFKPAIEPVEIPFEGTTLPGYVYRGGPPGVPSPTLVAHNGFDGSAEEMHFFGAAAAAERGFTVLTFDGPGQPGPLHRRGLVFRPDWENVAAPVLDFALKLSEVDPERVALMGVSMGGVLAPRAAAFERRLAAVIAWDGVYDMGATVLAHWPGDRDSAERQLSAPENPDLDAMLAEAAAADPTQAWAFSHGMWVTAQPTPRAFAAEYLKYNVRDGVAEKIQCPTLVCAGTGDTFLPGQPQELYEHLTCPKTLLEFTAVEGADAHCQSGAERIACARILDWLEETLNGTGVEVADGRRASGQEEGRRIAPALAAERASEVSPR